MTIGRMLALLVACASAACGVEGTTVSNPTPLPVAGSSEESPLLSPVHDPVLIEENGHFYLYSTGLRDQMPLAVHRSADLRHWEDLPAPFSMPQWVASSVPGARGFWAPDISWSGSEYRLYYSISTFGSQVSAIALATTPTLDPASPAYRWTDRGIVISSQEGDDFNAIDPNFIRDNEGRSWMSFGSFWGGLMLVELDSETGMRLPQATPIPIASRPGDPDNAVEAPFIFEREGSYYLIASFDHCCRGTRSDYHLVIGRADQVVGPYVDRRGVPMLEGGGSVLAKAAPDDRFRGTGHAGYRQLANGREILVFHAYDAAADGAPTLRLAELEWDGGWPTLKTTGSAR